MLPRSVDVTQALRDSRCRGPTVLSLVGGVVCAMFSSVLDCVFINMYVFSDRNCCHLTGLYHEAGECPKLQTFSQRDSGIAAPVIPSINSCPIRTSLYSKDQQMMHNSRRTRLYLAGESTASATRAHQEMTMRRKEIQSIIDYNTAAYMTIVEATN